MDLTLANSESQAAVTEFLHGMIRRELRPPLSITSYGAFALGAGAALGRRPGYTGRGLRRWYGTQVAEMANMGTDRTAEANADERGRALTVRG